MVASAKHEQDQNSGTGSMSTMPMSSQIAQDVDESSFESKEQLESKDDYAPKVRKPYTISKQRERWTEGEHLKFIEALKLYGRAWKRIEEHVGTKNAVQIRSHAQKFFTKVVRESSSGEVTSVKPVEIPPPRPKRKPVHPYPRKLASNSQRIDEVAEKPVQLASMSPCLSVLEHENRSPTSVLSAVDTSEANSPNGSLSPVSSATGVQQGFSIHSVPDKSSTEKENSSSNSEEEAAMKLLLISKDVGLSKEGSVDASSSRCLKLFGKTMIVTDSHAESVQPVETPLPWWNSCGFLASARVYNPVPIKPYMMPDNREAQDRAFRKEGSSSGSNTESACLEGDEDRKLEIDPQSPDISLDREMQHKYFDSRTSKACILKHRASIKGFVPYKRCVVAKGFVPYSSLIRQEGIEQGIRLSL